MIAHSSPPGWLFQLRNFGTPLLVIGSALTYSFIYSKKSLEPLSFYRKRLSRLIIPTWIFLAFFFISYFLVMLKTGGSYPFTKEIIIESFAFIGGIGFVWILKIYILLALITPIAVKINNNIRKNSLYFSILVASYIFYELIIFISPPMRSELELLIFNDIIFSFIPYSILYLFGFRMAQVKNKYLLFSSLVSLIIFISLVFIKFNATGGFVPTQEFKYPPTLYYLSYAFFSLNIIYLACTSVKIANAKTSELIIWLSSNSLWVYLWHIMAFYIWKETLPDPNGDFLLFIVKALFLFSFGIIIVILQNVLLKRLMQSNFKYKKQVVSYLS